MDMHTNLKRTSRETLLQFGLLITVTSTIVVSLMLVAFGDFSTQKQKPTTLQSIQRQLDPQWI